MLHSLIVWRVFGHQPFLIWNFITLKNEKIYSKFSKECKLPFLCKFRSGMFLFNSARGRRNWFHKLRFMAIKISYLWPIILEMQPKKTW